MTTSGSAPTPNSPGGASTVSGDSHIMSPSPNVQVLFLVFAPLLIILLRLGLGWPMRRVFPAAVIGGLLVDALADLVVMWTR